MPPKPIKQNPNIKPKSGKVGSTFTINDQQGRLQSGAKAVFENQGLGIVKYVTLTPNQTHTSATGTVPNVPTKTLYIVYFQIDLGNQILKVPVGSFTVR